MKKMLPSSVLPFLWSALFLFNVITPSLQAETVGINNCAVLIDRPDDLCDEMAAMTPLITCPQDVHVSCTHYTGNPSDYGQPVVNGHWQGVQIIEHPVQNFTNMCGIGYLIRTWTIHTPVGQFSCTQRITVTGFGLFGSHDIHWPLDYTVTNQCHGVPHPNDLPPPYNKPTWNHRPCSMIGISYKDDVFEFGDPYGSAGCKKIIRTWKVIDWCQYVPNTGQGLWMRTQVIKIEDNRRPTFIHCPQDFTVGVNNNCDGIFVNFPIPVAIDNCNPRPRITNNSSFANSSGADASGFYPLGMRSVRFIADDGCGNFDTCTVRVTVRDLKKPTPICYHGLTANLMAMGNDGFIRLTGKIFDAGSYDNCTPRSRLRFDIEPAEFTCENRGRNDVRVIVTDESGNTDFCVTYVIIQDPMGMCPPDTTGGLIAGLIAFHNDEVMEDVMLYVRDADELPSSVTDQSGIYLLDKLVEGKDYDVRPVKSAALNEGVNTLDLIMLRQHINGEHRFTDPYKIIAADVNQDGKVNIHDLNQLRLIMMSAIAEFPGLTPWRFVDKEYDFKDPLNPLSEDFTEIYRIRNHTKTDMKLDFVGIKVGDFDGTCMIKPEGEGPVIYTQNASRSSNQHAIAIDDRVFASNEFINIPLVTNKDWDISGMQFTLKFDTDQLIFDRWTGVDHSVFSNMLFSSIDASRGLLYFSWDNELLNAVDAETLLGELRFRTLTSSAVSNAIDFQAMPIQPQAYGLDFGADHLFLQFRAASGIQKTEIANVSLFPNPFSSAFQIKFSANASMFAELRVMDFTGKVVLNRQISTVDGINALEIQSSLLPGSGLYIVSLVAGDQVFNRSVMAVE